MSLLPPSVLVSSPFFCLPSSKTFKSPKATSFPLSSLLFPFPASWPWLQLWKIEKLWLLCHYRSISFFPSFTAPFSVWIQTDLSPISISGFGFSPLILYLLVQFVFHRLKLCLTLGAKPLLFSAGQIENNSFSELQKACSLLISAAPLCIF